MIRIIHALHDFLIDLLQGDPVAWTMAAIFLALLIVPAVFWIIDLRKKREAQKRKANRKPPTVQLR